MAEKIVGLISCLLCAVPFLIIGIFEKNSKEPITFWSGDKTLKSKVKDVTAYNLEMGMLYQKCAFAFMLSGICCLISLGFGIVMLVLDCTAGVYLMYRSYKKNSGTEFVIDSACRKAMAQIHDRQYVAYLRNEGRNVRS